MQTPDTTTMPNHAECSRLVEGLTAAAKTGYFSLNEAIALLAAALYASEPRTREFAELYGAILTAELAQLVYRPEEGVKT